MNSEVLSELSLKKIIEHQRIADLKCIDPLLLRHNANAAEVYEHLRRESEGEPIVTLFRRGMNIVWSALRVAKDQNNTGAALSSMLGVDLAVLLVRAYARPEGGFHEYDWNSWVPQEDMWRTIPWGTAFHGHVMLEVREELGDRLPETERDFWNAHLTRTGVWIYQNPVCGSFVFNCGMHLLSILWHLGKTFDHPEWMQWALDTAHARLRRDVDTEGWITGEDGGVSGVYQMLGSGFVARFARESGDPFLQEVSRKMLDLHVRFASRQLQWAGNFGTRSSCFDPIPPMQIVEEAAAGNGHAAALLRRCGTLAWTDWSVHTQPLFHEELWRSALATVPVNEPVQGVSDTFPGIEGSVVRAGGFHAWFFNYPKSLWARGFASLYHSSGPVFSTLHSLPTEIEKSKLLLGDTNDWAGFPHVRVEGPEGPWESQRGMSAPEIRTDDGVVVTWKEELLNREKKCGGEASFSCRFEKDSLLLGVELFRLSGPAILDFHIQRQNGTFTAYWLGEELQQIRAGLLPATGGQYMDRSFLPEEIRLAAVQIETTLYSWDLLEYPAGSKALLGLRKGEGLHSKNRGGVRLRLELPESLREGCVRLRFSISPTG